MMSINRVARHPVFFVGMGNHVNFVRGGRLLVAKYSTESKVGSGLKAASESSKTELSEKPQKVSPLPNIYVISIPLTKTKSYIYCNHKPSILNSEQAQKFPTLIKLENKAITLALKLWTKISTSPNKVNIKITEFVKRLLDTIRYEENCLKSFPSKEAMIRELAENDPKKGSVVDASSNLVLQSQVDTLQLTPAQLVRIPFYHPTFQKPHEILSQLNQYRQDGQAYHKKYAIACLIGVPLSLPFALVPILPNVPGFYIAYRLYCNIKALVGIKHLDYLLENDNDGVIDSDDSNVIATTKANGTSHLAFKDLPLMDQAYLPANSDILITKETIDKLCSDLQLENLKDDLIKALKQESSKIQSEKEKKL